MPLIVRRPKSQDPHRDLYDHDLPSHVIHMSDWMHMMSSEKWPGLIHRSAGMHAETYLINGRGLYKVRNSEGAWRRFALDNMMRTMVTTLRGCRMSFPGFVSFPLQFWSFSQFGGGPAPLPRAWCLSFAVGLAPKIWSIPHTSLFGLSPLPST